MLWSEILCERIGTQDVYDAALIVINDVLRRNLRLRDERQALNDALTKIVRDVWDRKPWSGPEEWLNHPHVEGHPVRVAVEYAGDRVGGYYKRGFIYLRVPSKIRYPEYRAKFAKELANGMAHEVLHALQFAQTPAIDYRQFSDYDINYPDYMGKRYIHRPVDQAKSEWSDGESDPEYFSYKVEIQAFAQEVAFDIWNSVKRLRDPRARRQQALARLRDPMWLAKRSFVFRLYLKNIRPHSKPAWQDFLKQTYQTLDRLSQSPH